MWSTSVCWLTNGILPRPGGDSFNRSLGGSATRRLVAEAALRRASQAEFQEQQVMPPAGSDSRAISSPERLLPGKGVNQPR